MLRSTIINEINHNYLNKSALICAVFNGETEIVRLLLTNEDIDVNIQCIRKLNNS